MAYKGQELNRSTLAGNGVGAVNPFNVAAPTVSRYMPGSMGSVIEILNGARADGAQPIWVDQTVRGLCDQAVALTVRHGAIEVGLEHLVHAMTQNEATSIALYELNIHVSSLKRETAAIILEDRSHLGKGVKGLPPKSDEFQEVLLHAADLAYARQSPVTTADIIDTLFDMSRDTTRKILHRHRPDFDLRDTTVPLSDEGRQKGRGSAESQHVGETHRLSTGVPSVTDTLQNTRMDAIERAIRDLTEDMARNRVTFSELMEELRDSNQNGIPDILEKSTNGHASSWDDDDANEISYLIGRMESNVDAKFKELARAWSVLGDRLKGLEQVVEDIDADQTTPFELTSDLDERLKSLAGALDRLDEFEKSLSGLPLRLTELERRLQNIATLGPSEFDVGRLTTKIESVEQLIKASDGAVELGPVMSSLRDVEAGMRGVGGQLREVDTRTGDVNLVLEGVSERQQRMEEIIDTQQSQIADLLRIVRDDFDLTSIGTSGGDRDAIVSSVGSAVAERFAGFSTQLQHRMAQLEDLMKGSLDRPVVVNGSGDVDTSYLSDSLVKIVTNQHTLAESMDEWRTQAREDVSAIAARMDRFENKPINAAALPEERFVEISDRLKHIQSTMPGHRSPAVPEMDGWTRFKMWLFGTSDWYGESWGGVREDENRVWQGGDADTPARPVDRDAQRNERTDYDNQRA